MSALSRENKTFFGVDDDTWIAISIWSILCYVGFLDSVNKIVNFFVEQKTSVDTIIVMLLFGTLIVLGTFAAVKRMERRIFLLVAGIMIIWVVNYLVNENSRLIMKMYYFTPIMIRGVCGMICIGHFKNWEKFRKVGIFFVLTGIVLFVISAFIMIENQEVEQYMPFSYSNLIFVVAAFWLAVSSKNILYWILGVAGFLVLLVVGCRGALVCVLGFLILEFLLSKKMNIYVKILLAVVAIVIFANIDNIMLELNTKLKEMDYESRTVTLFLEGEIENDSGRENIHKVAREIIAEKPVLGCGMAGSSYQLFKNYFDIKPGPLDNMYSHNLIYDIFLEYGVFIGLLIIVSVAVGIARAYLKNRKNIATDVMILFISTTLIKLMFSSIYLAETPFFMLLALLINLNFYTEKAPWEKGEADKNEV